MWHALNLQMISFPLESQIGVNADWWQALTGSDEYESTRKKLERVDEGAYRGRSLRMQVDPLRVAWQINPRVTEDDMQNLLGGGIPTIGDFATVAADFRDQMRQWLSNGCPPIRRLAFAGHLFWQQENREAVYQKLNELLPMEVDHAATEFFYRINRKRRSAVLAIDINRLSSWSALKFQLKAHVESSSAQAMMTADAKYGCSLQFDVNTPEDSTDALPADVLCALFDELIELAQEIATEGDIP